MAVNRESVGTTKRKPLTARQKVKLHEDQKRRGQHMTCASCEQVFYRPYPVDAKRALKPQYCTTRCKWDAFAARAESGREGRFWSHVDRRGPDDCWPWTAFRDAKGYGKFQWANADPRQAHRVAYFYKHGDWAPNFVCHSCDHPACCNPAHLWPGTVQQNNADMFSKGRARIVGPSSEKSAAAKLTIKDAQAVFLSTEDGNNLARRFNLSRNAISAIRARKTWRAATEGLTAPYRSKSRLPRGTQ